jgi:hypothetical protein
LMPLRIKSAAARVMMRSLGSMFNTAKIRRKL